MILFKDLCLRRGPRVLFAGVSFALHQGARVGLTGANGTGKSSLLALIRGELHADTGICEVPADWVVASVAQETPAVARSALDYVMDGDTRLRELEALMSHAQTHDNGLELARLHEQLDAIDGYRAASRAGKLLHGLGFAATDEARPVTDFSGGWRMRLNLAQALMCRSDLLLLDEPTNHLDLDAIIWLEQWLASYPGTLILISHDREFLDRVVSQIAHIERDSITLYSGNYSAFESARAEALAQQQAAYERQQRDIVHMERFVERFRAKATKARQAQSRVKALERMVRLLPAHHDSPFHFQFKAPKRLPDPLLKLDHASVGYGQTPVLSQLKLTLHPGDRLGILGPNGAGKSSLIRLLAGDLAPLRGEREQAPDTQLGYFAQHQLEQLDPKASPLLHLTRLDPKATEQSMRDFLGGFGFYGDRVFEAVEPFSGGEKARLVLAMLVYQSPNLLLLDEPTNHLDLEMRHALTMALQDYGGALVVVSHDRHLLAHVCDTLLLVHDGQVQVFNGDLEDYRSWLMQQSTQDSDSATAEPAASHERKQRRQNAAAQRQRLKPLRDRVKQLEQAHARCEAELQTLQTQLADPALYEQADKQPLQHLLTRQGALSQEIAALESAWLEACETLEQAEQVDAG